MSTNEAKELLARRDALDKEMEEKEAVLIRNGVDMNSELVDSEGFPRSDIDVYSVRHARAALIRLRNDRKDLTSRLASLLEQIHAENCTSDNGDSPAKVIHRTSNDPFVKVLTVTVGSPADLAGIQKDDLIIQFDTVHKDNFKEMKQLSVACQENDGMTLRVTALRDGRPVRLEIRPHRWSPDPKIGILGCAFVPVKREDSS